MSKENNLDEIEAKLAQTRESIAKNIDLIVEKTNPKNVFKKFKENVKSYISLPVVYIPLTGISVLILKKIVYSIFKK